MKTFDEFINEGELEPKSYHFNGELSTSSVIQGNMFSIWLNGGNAFRFKDLNLESLKKIEEDPYKQDELEKALMELVVKTLNDNIDALVKKIAEE